MGVRILIVEDDERIGASIAQALSAQGYDTLRASSGEEAFFMATTEHPDLMVLDLSLPGRDGLTVLEALRARDKALPVLIVSARGEVEDRVSGLHKGADDYLAKPFSMVELEARLAALLRRGRQDQALRLVVSDLVMDVALRHVSRGARTVTLTQLEFELLELLMRRSHSVVSRETLAKEIWKEVNRATPLDNVIDVHIGRLRKKIDAAGDRPLLHTIRGVGFTVSDRALG